MCRKLLKRIAVFTMAAALCTGVLAPMKAKAAEQADVIGTWRNGPPGNVTFREDGYAVDKYNTRAYHMESGSVTLTSGETISYDIWRGETQPYELKDEDGSRDTTVFKLNDDGTMTGWNIVRRGDDVFTYGACRMTKVGESGSDDESDEDEETEEEAAERKALEEAHREAVRLENEAAEQGFENAAQMQEAQSAGKSAAEYYNNAVVTTGGIENAVPVAQGGQLIIDGEVTNASATVSKVSSVYVDSVRAAREGRLLNVVDVRFPAHEAVVNFYMPGIEAGDTVTAVQFTDGTWTDVEVGEVRTDHVLLKLTHSGVVAFLEK